MRMGRVNRMRRVNRMLSTVHRFYLRLADVILGLSKHSPLAKPIQKWYNRASEMGYCHNATLL